MGGRVGGACENGHMGRATTRARRARLPQRSRRFLADVRSFDGFGRPCVETETAGVVTLVNEFWTSRQRQAHSLHEVSYRACFKPQLPAFFLERLTDPEGRVYDPFMGRGTTPLEAALRGRLPLANDVNPLSERLLRPRLNPPRLDEIGDRLDRIDLTRPPPVDRSDDLLVFFHPETLGEIAALRAYLLRREADGELDRVDDWIRMVAINRLTGHSPGFFSVYTLPPNQAVTAAAQRAINARRQQTPPRREVKERIVRKSRSLLKDLEPITRRALCVVGSRALLLVGPADATPLIEPDSVDLVVTSPPFLDVVDYADRQLAALLVLPGSTPLPSS